MSANGSSCSNSMVARLRRFAPLAVVAVVLCGVDPARAQVISDFNTVPPGPPAPCTVQACGTDCINNTVGDGLDGWTTNWLIPPSNFFTFFTECGSQTGLGDGYMRFIDCSPSNDGIVDAPAKYHGDWTNYFEFRYEQRTFQSDTNASPPVPRQFTISGPGGNATFAGPIPPGCTGPFPAFCSATPWELVSAPIDPNVVPPICPAGCPPFCPAAIGWCIDAGTNWPQLLMNVTSLQIKMELYDNPAICDERSGLDNIELRSCIGDFSADCDSATKEGTICAIITEPCDDCAQGISVDLTDPLGSSVGTFDQISFPELMSRQRICPTAPIA